MSCNIIINQQSSLPTSDTSASEAKVKDPEMQRRGKKSHKTYMKKLRENQEVQMTWKIFTDYFQQDLNDPASTLIAMEETIGIMKEDHNTEINISIGGSDYAENVWSKAQGKIVQRKMDPIFEHSVFDSARDKMKRFIKQLEKSQEAFENSLYTCFKCEGNNIFSVVK